MLGVATLQPDDNTHMSSRSDAVVRVVEHNQLANNETDASFEPETDNNQHIEETLSDADSEGML